MSFQFKRGLDYDNTVMTRNGSYYDPVTGLMMYNVLLEDIPNTSKKLNLYDADGNLITGSGKNLYLKTSIEFICGGTLSAKGFRKAGEFTQYGTAFCNRTEYNQSPAKCDELINKIVGFNYKEDKNIIKYTKNQYYNTFYYICMEDVLNEKDGVTYRHKKTEPDKFPHDTIDIFKLNKSGYITASNEPPSARNLFQAITDKEKNDPTFYDWGANNNVINANTVDGKEIYTDSVYDILSYVYNENDKYYLPVLNKPYYFIMTRSYYSNGIYLLNENNELWTSEEEFRAYKGNKIAYVPAIYKVTYSLEEVK